MNNLSSVDIDSELDFIITKQIMKNSNKENVTNENN